MINRLLVFFTVFQLVLSAQTFQWVKSHPISLSTNPTYISVISSIDNNGNPVSAHLINNRIIYGALYLGDFEITKRDPSGATIWDDTLFGKANIIQLKFDNSGNLFGAGTFRDTIYFDGNNLLTTNYVSPEGFVFKMDGSGNLVWFKKASQMSSDIYYHLNMTVDAAGNFWISSSDNQLNSTLKKFNTDGNLTNNFLQTGVRYISSTAVDNAGNIWVTGSTFDGPVSFNGYNSAAPFTYTEYIVKYSAQGVCQWAQYVQDITLQNYHIVCDNSGNAYLSGNLFTATNFGTLPAQGPSWVYDYFLTKINADGNFLWLREVPVSNTFGDATIGNGNIISYSADGNVYLTGMIRNTVNFGNDVIVSGFGSTDVMILKYSESGEILWGKNAGGFSEETGSSVITDHQGNCYVTGRIRELAVFDTISVNGSSMNTFIARISENIVPVELIAFTGSWVQDAVKLEWSASTEKNNHGFEVERIDMNLKHKWNVIGFVKGSGTSSEPTSYSFNDQNAPAGEYRYRLKQIDYDGSFTYSPVIEISVQSPSSFQLYQNYPNPFNPSTKIRYSIPENAGIVTLTVYDILGNIIDILVNEEKTPGVYEAEFITKEAVSSGFYFYKLSGNGFSDVKKMVVMR